jgi:histidinol dehydrogenase
MIDVVVHDVENPPARIQAVLSRTTDFEPELLASAQEVVRDVRERGDDAVLEYTRRFDGVELDASRMRVPEPEIEAAYRGTDPDLIRTITAAADNIRRFHNEQKQTSWFIEDGDGVVLGRRVLPIEQVGILIPGASAPLFSTLLMAAIPAGIAGVTRICMATPPRPDGSVHPAVLAAAHLVGVNEIYRVFGAQAVAALAYGTASIPRVDKLVGPGHPSVQIAKKLVFGTVDIDMVAGPSEIVVLADESANPKHVAADLLSQAEHGSGFEAAVCITPCIDLARQVADEVERQAARLDRREDIRRALRNFGAVVVVKDLDEGIGLANRIAPEHLELLVRDPWACLDDVRHAGAVFMGAASSEPVGDYYAGVNHILPTAGAARFASPVGVDTFLKSASIVSYTDRRLKKTAGDIIALAEAEGLGAHASAIRVRQE